VVAVGQQQYEVMLRGNMRIRGTFGATRFVVDAVGPLNDTLKRGILCGQSRSGGASIAAVKIRTKEGRSRLTTVMKFDFSLILLLMVASFFCGLPVNDIDLPVVN
jgi:hypothetical protein